MSVVFLLTPVVAAGWPLFCSAAAAAAATMGFSITQKLNVTESVEEKSVQLEMEKSKILTDQVREDDELILSRGDLVVRIYKDARGKCAVHVQGRGKSEQELKQEGTELLNRIKQQYAYQKVTQEMKNRGFAITDEKVTEHGRISIRLRKYE